MADCHVGNKKDKTGDTGAVPTIAFIGMTLWDSLFLREDWVEDNHFTNSAYSTKLSSSHQDSTLANAYIHA